MSTWTFYDPETQKKETKTFLDDELNGPFIIQNDDHIVVDGSYATGKKNATWKFYDDNGTAIREEVYEKGVRSGEWKYFNFKGYIALSKQFEKDQLIKISEYNNLEQDVLNIDINYENAPKIELSVEQLFEDSILIRTLRYESDSMDIDHDNFIERFKEKNQDSNVFVLNGPYVIKKGGGVEVSGNFNENLADGNWEFFYNTSIVWKKSFTMGTLASESFIELHTGEPLDKGEYVLWYGPERPKVEFKIKAGKRHGKSIWYNREGLVLKEEKYKEGILQ